MLDRARSLQRYTLSSTNGEIGKVRTVSMDPAGYWVGDRDPTDQIQ